MKTPEQLAESISLADQIAHAEFCADTARDIGYAERAMELAVVNSLRSIDTTASELARLREALNKYGAHQPDCDKWETVGDQLYFHGGVECTCGLDAALSSAKQD